MSPALDRFRQQCPSGAPITLVGPLLSSCPVWPCNPVVFVDGGARWRPQLPENFDHASLSVGDGDSLGSLQLDVLLDTSKDVSDLAFALQALSERAPQSLKLLGFIGGRRDHEWVNFGEVARFLSDRSQIQATFDREAIMLSPGTYTLQHHGVFSLVHFQDAHTAIRGNVDFELLPTPGIRAHSSHGLSNRAHGEFEVLTDSVALIFLNHKTP